MGSPDYDVEISTAIKALSKALEELDTLEFQQLQIQRDAQDRIIDIQNKRRKVLQAIEKISQPQQSQGVFSEEIFYQRNFIPYSTN